MSRIRLFHDLSSLGVSMSPRKTSKLNKLSLKTGIEGTVRINSEVPQQQDRATPPNPSRDGRENKSRGRIHLGIMPTTRECKPKNAISREGESAKEIVQVEVTEISPTPEARYKQQVSK